MSEKISIIIPVYNVELYLSKCIKSIISQTYPDLEVILINDGSNDKSRTICDLYAKKDNRIKVIHKNNTGISDSRNTGLEIAAGKYIGFVDSDDYIDTDMYENMHATLCTFDADIVECSYYKTFSSEEIIKSNTGKVEEFNNISALEELLLSKKFITSVWNKLYRTELLTGINFPKNRINEDEFWTYKVFFKAKKIIHHDIAKYHYRYNVTSVTKSYCYLEKMDKFYALEERLDFIHKNCNSLYNLAQKKFFLFIFGKYVLLENNKNLDKDKKYRNKIRGYILNNYKSLYLNPLMKENKPLLILFKSNPKIGLKILEFYNAFKPLIKKIKK